MAGRGAWSGANPVRALIAFVALVAVPLGIGVVLLASDFGAAWDGHAVSTRPARSEGAATVQVLIVDRDGGTFERRWPRALVATLGLPVDPMALGPGVVPADARATKKSRFALHYLVETPDAGFAVVPSTSPTALVLGLVLALVAVAVRNMAVAGAPWAIEPRSAFLPPAQAASGQIVSHGPGARPRKGPPPSRPTVGRGRR